MRLKGKSNHIEKELGANLKLPLIEDDKESPCPMEKVARKMSY